MNTMVGWGIKLKVKIGNQLWENKAMTAIRQYPSVITLNVNAVSSPIKSHKPAKWIKKQKSVVCCLQETPLTQKEPHGLKIIGWKTVFHATGTKEKKKRQV